MNALVSRNRLGVDILAKPPPEHVPNAYNAKTPTAAPLALTDDQLDQIMRHAAVLHPQLRHAFVSRVAFELRGLVIGDGVVHRACAKVLKESGMFDPPNLDSGRMPRVSKWDR